MQSSCLGPPQTSELGGLLQKSVYSLYEADGYGSHPRAWVPSPAQLACLSHTAHTSSCAQPVQLRMHCQHSTWMPQAPLEDNDLDDEWNEWLLDNLWGPSSKIVISINIPPAFDSNDLDDLEQGMYQQLLVSCRDIGFEEDEVNPLVPHLVLEDGHTKCVYTVKMDSSDILSCNDEFVLKSPLEWSTMRQSVSDSGFSTVWHIPGKSSKCRQKPPGS